MALFHTYQLNDIILMYSYATSTNYGIAAVASAAFTTYQFSRLISIRQQGQAAKSALLREANVVYREFNRFSTYTAQALSITKVTDKFSNQNFMKMINPLLNGGKDKAEALRLYIEAGYDGISQFSESYDGGTSGALIKNIPSKETLLRYIDPIHKMAETGYTSIVGGAAATAIFAALGYAAKDSESKVVAGVHDEGHGN